MGTLKSQSNEPLYSNTVISTLAADGWTVTFGTARRGRLKMREWKMRHGHNCRGGKCGEQTAGVENVGVSPMDSQPENKLRWR